ncbi:SLATT domain-containing protein [Micromonospora sp. NPDC005806]|uniref:SLATT domain-containing protein n=1 Tax=Micromonospora sp. NPDC005806 TaxID=3364234 RepID=UPI0036A9C118
MEAAAKLKLLVDEIDAVLAREEPLRRHDKRMALLLRLSAVTLSATVTVLLGLRVAAETNELLTNAALTLSALIVFFGAYDAFFNYRGLWVRRTIFIARLQDLKRRIVFYSTGLDDHDLSVSNAALYFNEFGAILADNMQEWIKLRASGDEAVSPRPAPQSSEHNTEPVLRDKSVG